MAAYTEDLFESVLLTESLEGVFDTGTYETYADETLDVLESLVFDLPTDTGDSVTVTDDVTIGFPVDLVETVSVTENLDQTWDTSLDLSETINVAEGFLPSVEIPADMPETVTVTDDVTLGFPVDLVETVSVTENLDQTWDTSLDLSETINVAEGFLPSVEIPADMPETVTVAETVDLQFEAIVFLGDLIGVTEDLIASKSYVEDVSDTVSVVEDLTTSQMEILFETVSITDSVETLQTGFQNAPEAVVVSEDAVTLVQFTNALPETVVVAEAVSHTQNFLQSVLDTVSVADTAATSYGNVVPIAESVLVADTFDSVRSVSANVSEFVLLSEAVIASRLQTENVGDTITVSDANGVSRGVPVTVSDTASVADSATSTNVIDLGFTETVHLIEVATIDGNIAAAAFAPDAIQVVFGSNVSLDRVTDPASYSLRPLDGGVPAQVISVEATREILESGVGGLVIRRSDLSAPIDLLRLSLPDAEEGFRINIPWVIPPSIGDYLNLTGQRYSFRDLRITAMEIISYQSVLYTTLTVDRRVVSTDPANGSLSWNIEKPVSSVVLQIDGLTKGANYELTVRGLQTPTNVSFGNTLTLIVDANGPAFESYAVDPLTGAVTLTFSKPLEFDGRLFNPDFYRITGPSEVGVVSVSTLSDRQIVIYPTPTFTTGSYQLVLPSFKDKALNRVGA
jgi:hypothetical protein